MADLNLKIRADFDQAHDALKKLSEESDTGALKLKNFGKAFPVEYADRFIERQNAAAIAMQATGRETDAVNSQVSAYQREIERLIKSGFDPHDEALKKLQSEYAGLLIKQDENIKASRAEAEAVKAAEAAEKEKAAALEESARKTVELLTASTDYEKKSIELKQRQEELKEEMGRLVKDGLGPESEEVKKLQSEYHELTQKVNANEAAHKSHAAAVKAATVALAAIGAAVAAGAGLAIKAAAANEDMIAAFTPLMQGDAEKATALFKTIQKEAATTPFEIDKIAASVKALMPAFGGSAEKATEAFRMLGDTAGGNAQKLESITSAYTKSMLKGKVSMMEINQIATAGVPIYSELAKSMGVTAEEMMEMSKKGKITSADLTKAFQSMTSEGGIFFKGMETSSDTFNMRLLGVKENAGILAGVIGEKLLPAAKDIAGAVLDAVKSFTDWIQEGDNFEKTARTAAIAIATATASLIAFTAAMKIHALITKVKQATDGLTFSVKALSMAIKKNPIGLIATGVAAGVGILTAVIGNHIAKQRELKQATRETTQAMAEQAAVAGRTEYLPDIKAAIEKYEKLLGVIEETRERLRNINADIEAERGREYFEGLADDAESCRNELEKYLNELNHLKISIDETLALTGQKYEDGVIKDIIAPDAAEKAEKIIKTLQQKLEKEISLSPDQQLNEQISQVKSFLNQRADLERADGEERITFIGEQLRAILSLETLSADERRAAEAGAEEAKKEELNKIALKARQALNDALAGIEDEGYGKRYKNEIEALEAKKALLAEKQKEILALYEEGSEEWLAAQKEFNKKSNALDDELAEAEKKIMDERLSAATGLFNGLSSLLAAAGKDNEAALIASRAFAISETAINTAVAITRAWRELPYYLAIPATIGIAANGAAQAAAIASAPIPSAETGGRFIVPDVSPRVDANYMRFNGGEEVSVTPRGMAGNSGEFTVNVILDGQVLARFINKAARAGELYNLRMASNL